MEEPVMTTDAGPAPGLANSAPDPAFRPMVMADLSEVMRNERRSYSWPWTAGIFADCIASDDCWVVESKGRIIGHGVLSHGPGETHLLNLCIGRGNQGRGHGRMLLEFLLDRARARGSETVLLEVRPSNSVALELYSSLGFREVGLRRDYYPAADGHEAACVMALEFT
jgi:ribosomal-protein-alanine N-acetyltransferase